MKIRQELDGEDPKTGVAAVLTGVWCGGSSRVAPVTPDSGLSGSEDAHRVTPHLDEVDSPGTETRQPARGLVTDIIHHLREGKGAWLEYYRYGYWIMCCRSYHAILKTGHMSVNRSI